MKITETSKYEEVQLYRFAYHPFAKPQLGVYLYYVDDLLIDTGQTRMSQEILKTIGSLKVQQIFVTHYHEDHSGNIALLQKHFDCPVYSSSLCAEMMKNPPPICFAQKMTWGTRPAYFDLQANDTAIHTPNFHFQIIPIPGHAQDMVALYEPHKRWLFSADLYINSYISYFLREESIQQQIESLKRVLALDFDTLFCSHNPQFKSGKNKLAEKLNFLEKFYEQVAQVYHQGLNARQIMRRLNLNEKWSVRFLSSGDLSKLNMVQSVIRDEQI